MKILNLYAGIGGNRKLWGNDHQITAVELEPTIAAIYQKHFPDDEMVITDAHVYLLEHFGEFDFVWASPPCPSHSQIRKIMRATIKDGIDRPQNKPIYPDMKLYEEILLLQGYATNKWVVENVVAWYEPFIRPYEVGGHYFWSNFHISKKYFKPRDIRERNVNLESRRDFDLTGFSLDVQTSTKLLRNCVEPDLGKYIFDAAFKGKQELLV